jgi:2-dehydropantoate 2-reductase
MPEAPTHSRRETIAVVGVGGIGGVVAGLLRTADRHDVVACVKTPLERLIVECPDNTVEVSIRSSSNPAEATYVDWVLLCTKVHDIPSTAPWLNRLCRSGTRVAVLQNGIGHATRLAPLVGGASIVPTIVYFNGERLGEGRVRFSHARPHDLAVSDDAAGTAFANLLAGTPLRTRSSDDLDALAWRKLLLNAVANPLTALTMQRLSVFRHDDVQALSLALLEEGVAVGRAEGVRLAPDEAPRILAALLAYSADASTSMYFDRMSGRPLEVEALTGAIVACGDRHGVATPLNTAVLTLLRAANTALSDRPPSSATGGPPSTWRRT